MVQAAGIARMLAGVNYFAEQVLHAPAVKTLLFVCFVGPELLVMPVWTRVGLLLGKQRGYWAASLLFALGALMLGAGTRCRGCAPPLSPV
jgi:Na+/melibiose symporter-like transporter